MSSTNYIARTRMEELKGSPYVNKLFYLALQVPSRELVDLLDEVAQIGSKRLLQLFPKLGSAFAASDLDDIEDGEELLTMLTDDHSVLGWLAEFHVSECYDFKWKADGSPGRFAVSNAVHRIEYLYADTVDELLKMMPVRAQEVFDSYVARARKKQQR